MYGTLKKIIAFAGSKEGLLKKSLLFAFLSGLFAALQFAALFIVVEALVSDNRDSRFIWISLGIMAVSLVGRIITTYFSTMEQTETGYCMVAEKRIHIGDRLRYIPMGYFNKNSIGNITAIVTTTLGDVENSAARVLVSVLGGFFNSVALVIVLLVFDWRIGLIAAIGVLLYLAAAELALRKSACLSGVRQHTQESLVESVLEYIQGMGIVKAFGMEKDSTQSIDSAIKASCRDNLKLTKASVPYDALKQVVVRVFSVLLPLASIYFWLNGSLSLAYGVILVIASFMVFNDLENAGNMASLLQMLAASMDTANSIDDTPVMDEKGADVVPASSEIIFDNVDFSYADRKILDHVSFTIPAGTTTAIVGPSGSGKTTMCNLIARFWDVSKGTIRIGGKDIKDLNPDGLLHYISEVFQENTLLSDTIYNNIKAGRENATEEEIKKAYRSLSRRYHPDANINNPNKDQAEEKFKEVQQAYEQIMKEREYGSSSQNGYGGYGNYGGFGNYGNAGSSAYQDEESMRRRAAANYVQSGHFQEAMNVLDSLGQKNGEWYYLAAMANMGMGNNVTALDQIREAVRQEPDNMQYRMLLQRMEGGGGWYQQRQDPFGGMPTAGGDMCDACCRTMACFMCWPGGFFCC